MRVLFVGGTGIISTACTQLAAERGIDLTLLTRGRRDAHPPAGVKTLVVDMDDQAAAAFDKTPHGRTLLVGHGAEVGENDELQIRAVALEQPQGAGAILRLQAGISTRRFQAAMPAIKVSRSQIQASCSSPVSGWVRMSSSATGW